jgi:hypothetical protein
VIYGLPLTLYDCHRASRINDGETIFAAAGEAGIAMRIGHTGAGARNNFDGFGNKNGNRNIGTASEFHLHLCVQIGNRTFFEQEFADVFLFHNKMFLW